MQLHDAPKWVDDRIRDRTKKNLEWVEAGFGYEPFSKLRQVVDRLNTAELADMLCLTESIVSMLNFEVRRAEKIFDEKEDMKRAKMFKKKLDALFKRGGG